MPGVRLRAHRKGKVAAFCIRFDPHVVFRCTRQRLHLDLVPRINCDPVRAFRVHVVLDHDDCRWHLPAEPVRHDIRDPEARKPEHGEQNENKERDADRFPCPLGSVLPCFLGERFLPLPGRRVRGIAPRRFTRGVAPPRRVLAAPAALLCCHVSLLSFLPRPLPDGGMRRLLRRSELDLILVKTDAADQLADVVERELIGHRPAGDFLVARHVDLDH